MFDKVSNLNKLIGSIQLNDGRKSQKMRTDQCALVELLIQQVNPKSASKFLRAPSRMKLEEILALLRKIVFGASLEEDGSEFRLTLGIMVSQVSTLLEEEVYRALLHDTDGDCSEMSVLSKAKEIVAEFMEALPKVRMLILKDVDACFQGDPAAKSPLEIILCYPGIEATFVYRVAHLLHQMKVPLVPRMMSEICHNRTAIDIHPGATIGCPFFIDHGTGVVIGETATVGNNVTLFHNVTLGAISTSAGQALAGMKRHPTIEDGVTIYAGAAVLGGKTVIGKGSIIGGGLMVCRSIPPGQVVRQLAAEQRYLVVPHKPRNTDTSCQRTSSEETFGRLETDVTVGRLETDATFGRPESDMPFGRLPTDMEFGRMETDATFGRLESDMPFGRLPTDIEFGRMETDSTCGSPENRSFDRPESDCNCGHLEDVPSPSSNDTSHTDKLESRSLSPLVKKGSDERIALIKQCAFNH
jgi:serine O-acetyltransferase